MKKLVDFTADVSLFVFGAASIMLTALDHPLQGATAGLLSEPGFFWASYKSRMWSLWVLTVWWTGWWAVLLYRNL